MDSDSDRMKDDVIVDYYNHLPGPCGECCLRFPCPSILACVLMIAGDVLLLAGFHLGAEAAQDLFVGTPVSENFNTWFSNIQILVYCLSIAMFLLAIILLGMGCLGTGATRSIHFCRFKTRRSGRCQTAVFLLISYVMFLGWLTATCFAVVPVFFMYTMNRGVCFGVEMQQQTCLSLVQWGLLPPDTPVGFDKEFICNDKMENICNSNLMLFFSMAFVGCIFLLISSVQYTVNLSSNFAHLLDRYKRAYVSGTAGSYNMRSGVRDAMIRGSKRSNTRSQQQATYGGSRPTDIALTRIGGTGNGAFNSNGSRYEDSEPDQRYSSLEMTAMARREEAPPNPPPYLPSAREPVSNLQQHRARSYDPLDYNDYDTDRLDSSRIKNMSRSAEPIDLGSRYDRYNDRYNEYDL